MRRFIASLLTLGIILTCSVPPAAAADDKQLQNLKGSVSYRTASGSVQPVAVRASAVVQENDTAQTAGGSMGAIDLPDSSRILLGANTSVKIDRFDQADITTAAFEVVGKVRFKIEHPKGARANYTFKSSTAQIAVRGTTGDIAFGENSLQVNVYELTDPALPVAVTLNNGQVFFLHAGQSLTVTFGAAAATIAQAAVQNLSPNSVQPFSEFGAPANAGALGLTAAAPHVGLFPLLTAIIVDSALLTLSSRTPSSSGTASVPVHVTGRIRLRVPISLPFIHRQR